MIVAPTTQQLRRVLRLCADRPVPRTLPEEPASGLSFSEIVAAIRAGQSATQALANMARARASKTVLSPTDETPRLEDLVGLGEAKEWGTTLVSCLSAWKRNEVQWSSLSTAAVLFGPPGTGKSMMARSLAKSCGIAYIGTSVGSWFGTSGGHLDDIIKAAQSAFDNARAQSPSLLFVDELDSVPNRTTLSKRNRDFWTPVVNFLLTLFDTGTTNRDGTILLDATNFAENLDDALVRPGRFDRLIRIPQPTSDDIAAIMRMNLGTELPGANLHMVAKLGGRATGASASGWVRQARAMAQAAGRSLTLDDLVAAVAPKENRSVADVWRVAVHEAGHAVAGLHFGHATGDVSIVKSMTSEGRASLWLPGPCPTASDIETVAICLLAGRAAEIEFLGAPSAGAEGDLERATSLVAAALTSFGLAGELVHLAPSAIAAKTLRRDLVLRKEVSRRLAALQEEANAIVRGNAAVEAIARELVARRALAGDDVRQIAQRGRL